MLEDPIARARALVAGATFAVQQQQQTQLQQHTTTTDDPSVIMSSPRPEDGAMPALQAARALAAAATRAAQAMSEMTTVQAQLALAKSSRPLPTATEAKRMYAGTHGQKKGSLATVVRKVSRPCSSNRSKLEMWEMWDT